jgi:hypothetical protein
MTKGLNGTKIKKKPWNTKIERDIILHKDIKDSGFQGGKVIGDKLSLFSFIIGIPLFIIGIYGLINMVFGLGISFIMANVILILLVISIGLLLIIGGIFISKNN